MEFRKRGLRLALGKVKRRELCYLPLIKIVVLLIQFFIFCDLNV